ncbi:kinase-like protein [Xylariaceae sp. FL1651]|nr:kinase-like protein [Xylariaceae sp. FL1651]
MLPVTPDTGSQPFLDILSPTLTGQVKDYFVKSKYWEHERLLGHGAYGFVSLLREKVTFGRSRRISLKLALPRGKQQLENEISWLKRLRGARHLVTMLASCDDIAASANNQIHRSQKFTRRVVARFTKLFRVPPRSVFDSLAGVQGPAVALEYIENGSLISLQKRLRQRKKSLPNRILWSICLCLIRACVGMAYPMSKPEGAKSILETIPTDGTPPGDLMHGDIAGRNVVVGTGDRLNEHRISIIDRSPTVDPVLRDFVAQCMAPAAIQRPTLRQALDRAHNAVLMKKPDSFPDPSSESNNAIREVVQELIYDATL